MSYTVYVLKAANRKLRYVGFTKKDIEDRLNEHDTGKISFQNDTSGKYYITKKTIVENVQDSARNS